ncbi:30S ribosomal protein S20 [Desulfonema magnum]|uniref:Small ribosomal subunit protein bS20 n=1 Tax=Desulfonema magnum TaxID=45655 RepID=A0A975BQ66_9BACT|nr:30S ribosomal protein S20 [Desulfonema magnum]QTA89169.1 30S ribosomal protein S20 [Desulfonema magnum]
MANHKSALKRARQNEVRRIRNKASKTRIKSILKDIQTAVDEKSSETATEQLNIAKSAIDRAAKKGVIHKRYASRKISRLSKLVNRIAA